MPAPIHPADPILALAEFELQTHHLAPPHERVPDANDRIEHDTKGGSEDDTKGRSENDTKGRSEKVRTGFADLDGVLEGGLRRGRGGVVALCGRGAGVGEGRGDGGLGGAGEREGEGEVRRVLYGVVVRGLLGEEEGIEGARGAQDARGGVAIIDTVGNFDVMRLFEHLVRKLKEREMKRRVEEGKSMANWGEGGEECVERAKELLERVRIMRVFDFVGVREAVGEIRDGLDEGRRKKREGYQRPETGERKIERVEVVTPAQTIPSPRREVADSEDEDDEMLLDSTQSADLIDYVPPAPVAAPVQGSLPKEVDKEEDSPPLNIELIIIDNITQVINPYMKNNYVQAQALLTSFLRTLTHLTTTHNLLTLLINTTIKPYTQSTHNNPCPSDANRTQHSTRAAHDHPPMSIFASNTSYPALGQTFPHYVDVMLLVSQLPLTRREARIYYAEDVRRSGERARGVRMGTVVEVVYDRLEGRVGRWAMLEDGDGG